MTTKFKIMALVGNVLATGDNLMVVSNMASASDAGFSEVAIWAYLYGYAIRASI